MCEEKIKIIITQYLEKEYISIEQKLSDLFFGEEVNFKTAVYRNSIEEFFKNKECKNSEISEYSKYPVLYAIFSTLFKLLIENELIIWGGINFWDNLKNDFYSEQFVKKDMQYIPKVMQWLVSSEGKNYVLPLTTFVFERLPSPPPIILFYKGYEEDDGKENIVGFKIELKEEGKNVPNLGENFQSFDTMKSSLEKFLKKFKVTFNPHPELTDEEMKKFENLFKIFEMVTQEEWNYLYYISSLLKPQAKVAGLLLISKEKLNNIFINFLRLILGRIVAFYEFAVSLYQTQLHALRSAVATIMSRNMSHNIGSHVLNYLSNPEELDSFWII